MTKLMKLSVHAPTHRTGPLAGSTSYTAVGAHMTGQHWQDTNKAAIALLKTFAQQFLGAY